jgi:hypothetical protein
VEAFEVRDSPQRAVGTAVALVSSAIVPSLIAYLIWTARDDLSVVPLAGLGLGVTGVLMILVAGSLLLLGIGRLRGGLRRRLIAGVDRRGILLGREVLGGPERFIGWERVRGLSFYTLCDRSGVGEDPPVTYVSYLQVNLTDGTADRRSAPEGPDPWPNLANAVERVAPGTPVEFHGVLPEGKDPMARP